jgi:hypothetical protein
MTRYNFLSGRLRATFPFHIPLFVSIVICLTVHANAQDRGQSFAATQEGRATGLIEAVVTEVQGNTLTIAGGIVIDISRAVIFSIGGGRLDISIKPGMCIRASVAASDDASSTLIAEFIRVQPEDRIVFSGLLQGADLEHGEITILNRRILITSETSIPVGFKLRKIKAGLPVSVVVKPSGAEFVATVIFPNIVLPNIFP